MAVQGCPPPVMGRWLCRAVLFLDSEEESGAAGPARPLPSMQTFAFQTQMRRCRASGRAGGGGRACSAPLALPAPSPAPCVRPPITCVHMASASATLSGTSLLGALL